MSAAPPPGGMGGAPPPGGPIGYYAPPASGGARPGVILWFRVYAAASALLYVGFLFLWQLMAPSPSGSHHTSGEELAILLGVSVPILLLYGIGALIPYKPWGWTYALILIGLGMLGCMAPFSVVLIIFWSRPEVKAAFQRL